jgi:Lipid A core - O-antigen ligase and related enzymes
MTASPIWRTRLFAVGAGAVAIWLSVELAHGEYRWPAFAGALLCLFLLTRLQPHSLSTLALTAGAVGYIVGSRGFAQLSLSSQLPLLPAELILLLGGSLILVHAAWRHELPLRREPVNLLLLGWMVYGTCRVVFDVRTFGILALRDFALVYYAAFFFLGQELAREMRATRLFENALLASCLVLMPLVILFDRFPDFFFGTLVVRGNPLIFYKGDLAGTFMAVGSVLFFNRFEERRRPWLLIASLALAGGVVLSNNRASMLGLAIATAWLAVVGRWRFAIVQSVTGGIAALVIVGAAAVLQIPWEKTPVYSLYERVASIADVSGQRTYRSEDSSNKGDNNLYRTIWWRSVIDETLEGGPWLGLGFGRDLADRFVREYYPENSDEFNVRSPHNVLLSIFARMGAVGLLLFLALLGAIAVRSWRSLREHPANAGLWCALWAILTSACFGVVLEGPMGAMIFWTVLGVACGREIHSDQETTPPSRPHATAP